MIRHLKGKVLSLGPDFVVLDVNGVGYKLGIYDLSGLEPGNEQEFDTYLAVKEDALDLYGFRSGEELALFEELLSVSGVGPKSAMTILSKVGNKNLRSSIEKNDVDTLIRLGVGRKTAERVILELSGKRGKAASGDDAVAALVQLGYKEREAVDALAGAEGSLEGRVKEALKRLQK